MAEREPGGVMGGSSYFMFPSDESSPKPAPPPHDYHGATSHFILREQDKHQKIILNAGEKLERNDGKPRTVEVLNDGTFSVVVGEERHILRGPQTFDTGVGYFGLFATTMLEVVETEITETLQ